MLIRRWTYRGHRWGVAKAEERPENGEEGMEWNALCYIMYNLFHSRNRRYVDGVGLSKRIGLKKSSRLHAGVKSVSFLNGPAGFADTS